MKRFIFHTSRARLVPELESLLRVLVEHLLSRLDVARRLEDDALRGGRLGLAGIGMSGLCTTFFQEGF
eukprot:40499-Prymnesium_polylepis.1